MAAYRHGVYSEESPTQTPSLQRINSGITVSIGLSPVHLAANPVEANRPTLCYNKETYVNRFGETDDLKTYTNQETAEVMYDIFNVSPVVFINVFDPKRHKNDVEKEITLTNGAATLAAPVLLDTLAVTSKEQTYTTAVANTITLEKDDDYTVKVDDDGNVTVTVTNLNKVTDNKMIVSYSQPDPTKVTADDIIGKVDPTTGKCSGIKLISEVYARTGILAGTVIAPGWSKYPKVAAALAAAVESINGHFKAVAPVDLDTTQIGGYADAAEWKNNNGFTNKFLLSCYPMVGLSGTLYHGSTYLAALLNRIDGENDEIPFVSPSNKAISIDGMYNEDGTENYFGLDAANSLNGEGIFTYTNFNGWKMWGNRTSIYPQSKDAKDNFISVRRMFNFVNNTLIINYWSQIDEPANRRLIDSVVNSANTYLDGLTNRGALQGGRVEFVEDDNTTSDLMDGKLKFRVYICPPSPAREIVFVQEYDPDYLSTLFV